MKSPYYTRIAMIGICLYLAVEVVILIAILVYEPSEWAYPLIVGGIAAFVGTVIYFVRPWGLIVGIAAGVFGIMFSIDSIGENLSSPYSFLDFAYRPVVCMAGAIFVLGGSTAGLVQHFRRRTDAPGPAIVSLAVKGVLGVVSVLAVFSAILTVTGTESVSAADRAGATTITAHVTKFDKSTLQAKADGTSTFLLDNNDPIVHTFTIDALAVDVKVGPRSEKLFTIPPTKPGNYAFYCRITSHDASMSGTLTIE